MKRTEKEDRWSIEMFLRTRFKNMLEHFGRILNRTGLAPNTVTILGLAGNLIGSYLIAVGHISIGGIIILLMGPIDAIDGTMARLRGEPSRFGGFVDSVTDRYSELVIFGGLLYYFSTQQDWNTVHLIYFAACGTVLVSYIRARAEGLRFNAKVGIMTRVERYLILAPCLVFNYPKIAIWIIAVLANFTALQRIWVVWQQSLDEGKNETS